jgi:hypothetical protein
MTEKDRKDIKNRIKYFGVWILKSIYETDTEIFIVIYTIPKHELNKLFNEMFIEFTSEQFKKDCVLWKTEKTWDHINKKNVVEITYKV